MSDEQHRTAEEQPDAAIRRMLQAAEDGDLKTVSCALSREQVDWQSKNERGESALWLAGRNQHIKVVEILLLCSGIPADFYQGKKTVADIANALYQRGTSAYNKVGAVDLYKLAADLGSIEAHRKLVVCYERGMGVAQDKERAAQHRQQISIGETLRLRHAMLAQHQERDADTALIETALIKAADEDRWEQVDEYLEQLGINLEAVEEAGVTPLVEAIHPQRSGQGRLQHEYKIALLGHALHAEGIRQECSCSSLDLPQASSPDQRKIAQLYRLAANLGCTEAFYDLGRCYEEGFGVTKNLSEAFRLYQCAAECKDRLAQHRLGLCYETGQGVTQNVAAGLALHTALGEAKHPIAGKHYSCDKQDQTPRAATEKKSKKIIEAHIPIGATRSPQVAQTAFVTAKNTQVKNEETEETKIEREAVDKKSCRLRRIVVEPAMEQIAYAQGRRPDLFDENRRQSTMLQKTIHGAPLQAMNDGASDAANKCFTSSQESFCEQVMSAFRSMFCR